MKNIVRIASGWLVLILGINLFLFAFIFASYHEKISMAQAVEIVNLMIFGAAIIASGCWILSTKWGNA